MKTTLKMNTSLVLLLFCLPYSILQPYIQYYGLSRCLLCCFCQVYNLGLSILILAWGDLGPVPLDGSSGGEEGLLCNSRKNLNVSQINKKCVLKGGYNFFRTLFSGKLFKRVLFVECIKYFSYKQGKANVGREIFLILTGTDGLMVGDSGFP